MTKLTENPSKSSASQAPLDGMNPTPIELAEIESRFGNEQEEMDIHDIAAAIIRAQGGFGR